MIELSACVNVRIVFAARFFVVKKAIDCGVWRDDAFHFCVVLFFWLICELKC